MKKHFIFHLRTFVLVSIMLMSCTKDNLLIDKQELGNPAVVATKEETARIAPATTGVITGILSPVPAYAEITAYTTSIVKNIFGRAVADENGQFKIADLPAGRYNLLIRYSLDESPYFGYSPSITIQDVEVTGLKNTDLGIIYLR